MSRPLLIIDGLNLFVRHFVVNPTLNESGEHVGGVVGFLRALGHLSSRTMPGRIIVVWEGGGAPRRRAIYSDYKNKRRPQRLNRYYEGDIPDTVENRNDQISILISIIKSLPVDQIYINDCEADDIIGYIVKNMLKERCVIVSSDKDLYQLLSKKVIQWSPGQKKFVTLKDVREKFGISAKNFCTARCFVGDSSDGLPGIPLAGFTSLAKRFPGLSSEESVSVEDIVEISKSLENNTKLKIIKNICEHADIARRNWKLMYLDTRNISFYQVQKIVEIFENPHLHSNKLQLIKSINKYGIKNLDVDSLFASISVTRKNK